MNHAIEVTSLEKRYGAHKVLKGLTFSVRQGEIFALLGANGAGKTTTLECLEGLRPYDSGCIVVSGKRGIQLQSASLPGYLQCREARPTLRQMESRSRGYRHVSGSRNP